MFNMQTHTHTGRSILPFMLWMYKQRELKRWEILHPSTKNLYRICKLYWLSLLFGVVIWLIDQHFCDLLYNLPFGIPNPQLHAWWHVAVGLNSYAGTQFVIYTRSKFFDKVSSCLVVRGEKYLTFMAKRTVYCNNKTARENNNGTNASREREISRRSTLWQALSRRSKVEDQKKIDKQMTQPFFLGATSSFRRQTKQTILQKKNLKSLSLQIIIYTNKRDRP